jgi:SpoVK/Ycf46/Vps4 family AAA+-type ATPase
MFARHPPRSFEEFGEVLYPDMAQEPILAKPVRDALTEWLTEIWAADELKAVGLKPRQKALFTGPPGGGKTTLAHHLAARLKLALVSVRSDRLIDKYIGSTGQNIGGLFDLAAKSEPVVLFIDEFESLGLKRRKAQQGAEDERNASVNTLLQRMEQYDGFLIAASNMADAIDEAIWRRFDLQIIIAMPGQSERERILARYLAPYKLDEAELSALAESFAESSPALMRQFCEGLKRQLIIGPRVGWDMERDRVFARLLAAVGPHPDLPRPRLWHRGINDPAVSELVWPLTAPEVIPLKRKAVA